MEKVFIIAEAGVNHNGHLSMAKELIDIASKSGADAVKFQSFFAEEGISINAPKADYQLKLTPKDESQIEMIKRLELSYENHVELINYCKQKEIQFISTVCDLKSVDLLKQFDLPVYKIASCDLVHTPLIRCVAKLKKKVILSTGMSVLDEVSNAVLELRENGTKDIVLLHCTTEYPCPLQEINLHKITTLKNVFDLPVGFSDHSEGIIASIAAVALGAGVIEKHFTLDKNLEGPDHKASLEPREFFSLVKSIREVEQALGNYEFIPTESELRNKNIMRRKIVAAKPIKKGEVFSLDNLAFKRAEGGLTPDNYDSIAGKISRQGYSDDEVIIL